MSNMKLKEINFNRIRDNGHIGLAIKCDGKWLDEGFIGEVLKRNVHLAEREVIEQHSYFNEYVVEILP